MFLTLTLLLIDSPLVYEEVKEHELTLSAGRYKIECFRAQGGSASYKNENTNPGGKGAYVYGTINICGNGTLFYLFVGGKGEQYPQGSHGFPGYNAGGFNGGGDSGHESGGDYGDCSGGGGGATDIRTIRDDVNSRIIVAVGGSGGVGEHDGAPGGDIKGKYYSQNYVLANSTETDNINGNADGKGGNGKDSTTIPGSGGGGGWRGGVSTNDFPYLGSNFYVGIAHSGSSYISGHDGCEVNKKYVFDDTNMTVGYKDGNGKIIITLIYECPSKCFNCTSEDV